MRVLHIVPGLDDPTNGIAVAAKLIAREQSKSGAEVEVVETKDFISSSFNLNSKLQLVDEVWVHSMWLPMTLKACWKVLRNVRMFECSECSNARPKLVRMTHANLDPLRYHYHGWKKRLVAPIERWLFRRTDRVVVTCEAEKKWCQEWGLRNEFEVVNLKKFFDLNGGEGLGRRSRPTVEGSLHVLYLGRRHPLKGVEFLERAVREIGLGRRSRSAVEVELRIVSDHFGVELEKDWAWCDVLCLPTLSENFGLVVAEALERGKKVITTDGAPAWEPEGSKKEKGKVKKCGRLIYLCGYRDGTDAERVELLKEALRRF